MHCFNLGLFFYLWGVFITPILLSVLLAVYLTTHDVVNMLNTAFYFSHHDFKNKTTVICLLI